MLIKIGNYEYSEVWDRVYYRKLSNYPHITNWEIKTILDFIKYENKYNRNCEIECEDKKLLNFINKEIKNSKKYTDVSRPLKLTECTACRYRKGCITEYVCHTTSLNNAIEIFKCGKLLSALKARKIPVEQLIKEKRNAAHDPEDYFEYIMFSWGNCQAGDRLVMERELGRFPNDKDLSIYFKPGIRFYFKYDQLIKHPNSILDGFLPLKVKDEIKLVDWVDKIIIPEEVRLFIEVYISSELKEKVIYVENDCKDIWDWSEKVYTIIENRG